MIEEVVDKRTLESEADTKEFAQSFSERLKEGDIALLKGDLGSGKTFFVQKICEILDIDEEVTSPTFALMQHYSGKYMVNHFDFYRIENEMELENLGWEEMVYSDAITFIEWPQIIEDKLDKYYLINIEFKNEIRQVELRRVEK